MVSSTAAALRGRRRLRVLGCITFAYPDQLGGSEVALHRLLAWLAAQGHEVRCLVTRRRGVPTDGVVYQRRSVVGQREWWAWADVAITHLGAVPGAAGFAAEFDVPLVMWSHNWWTAPHYLDHLRPERDAAWWNTEALGVDQGPFWPGAQAVVHPPVWPHRYHHVAPEAFVAVNLSELKGGPLLWRLARQFPKAPFRFVMGGWGEQVTADGHALPVKSALPWLRRSAPPNVTVEDRRPDLAPLLSRARAVLVPTGRVHERQVGESYGLVAAEAVCSGAPVVASDSPGMREAVGDAGVLLDPDDEDAWVDAVAALLDDETWGRAHRVAEARRPLLDPVPDLLRAERFLEDLCGS